MHEGLGQQRGRTQTRLGHAHGIAQEYLRLQQLVEQREDYAVEQLLDLALVFLVQKEVRPEDDALQVDEGCVSDFTRGVRRLTGQGG